MMPVGFIKPQYRRKADFGMCHSIFLRMLIPFSLRVGRENMKKKQDEKKIFTPTYQGYKYTIYKYGIFSRKHKKIKYRFLTKCSGYFTAGALYNGTVLQGSPYIIDLAKGFKPFVSST